MGKAVRTVAAGVLAGLCLLAASCAVTRPVEAGPPTVPAPSQAPLGVERKTTGEQSYPYITSGSNADALNRVIADEVEYLNREYGGPDDFGHEAENSFDYEILMNEAGILSIGFFGTTFTETAAHPLNYCALLSVDVASGARIKLADWVVIDDALALAIQAAGRAELESIGVDASAFDEAHSLDGIKEMLKTADVIGADGARAELQTAITPTGVEVTMWFEPHALRDYLVLDLDRAQLTLASL